MLLSLFSFNNGYVPLIIGSCIIVIAIVLLVFYLKIKKNFILYFIFLINMIAMGFLIKSWHVYRNYNLDLYVFLLISIACCLYLLLFYLLSLIPLLSKYYKLFLIIFIIGSIISYVILITLTETNYLSTLGFYMIIELGFLLSLSVYTKDYVSLIKSISFSSFLVIIVAIIITIIMLDGDFDLDITGGYFDVMSPREQERYNKK